MRRIVSTLLVVLALSMSLAVLAGCAASEGDAQGKPTLTIVKQAWTGDSSQQPDPLTEMWEVKTGESKTLESTGSRVTLEVVSLGDGVLTLKFDTEGVVRSHDGTIDLMSQEYYWTDEILEGQDYQIATQTLDAGTFWILRYSG
ncbi:MAG: hypothetical protein LBD25_07930 [Coriobacteriales bacterium]|jgi:ABC-type glycerol-3-phosphate transport system substrate-binding protein|nr:hypothetical protein [Coriobacteriales bacterium]